MEGVPTETCTSTCERRREIDRRIDGIVADLESEVLPRMHHRVVESMIGGVRRDAVRALRRAGRYAVPGSVALAVSGFCVCVVFFHPRGIPLSALTSPQLAAAGVLYAGVTWIAVATGLRLSTKSVARTVGELAMWAVSFWAVLGVGNLRGPVFVAVYFLLIAGGMWSISKLAYRRHARPVFRASAREQVEIRVGLKPEPKKETGDEKATKDVPFVSDGFRTFVAQWLLSTVVFGVAVYPQVPAWLGGGAPRRVELLWATPPTPEEVALVGDGASARCLFEQAADADHLYLASVAPFADGKCVPPQLLFWVPPHLDKRETRYIVVPRSRVRLTVYRGGSVL